MSAQNLQLAKLAVSGLSVRDRQVLIRELSGQPAEIPADRILRRLETAKRFGVGLRCVDEWARKGILKKRILPGHTRACGFLESDVVAMVEGRTI